MTSYVNGYITANVMKFFGATDWCFAAIFSATIFPIYCFFIFLAVDLIEYLKHSAFETPPLTIILLGALWCSIAIPLSFRGAYSAFHAEKGKNPLRVSRITKTKVPDMPTWLEQRFTIPYYGAIIFGSIFIEFKYVMDSVWGSQIYAMYGYLLLNSVLLTIIISLLSILQTYHLLNNLNWHWWWRAFNLGASGGIYMMVYSLYFMIYELHLNIFAGELIYFLYMLLCTTCFSIVSGTISVAASYLFIRHIYANVKGE